MPKFDLDDLCDPDEVCQDSCPGLSPRCPRGGGAAARGARSRAVLCAAPRGAISTPEWRRDLTRCSPAAAAGCRHGRGRARRGVEQENAGAERPPRNALSRFAPVPACCRPVRTRASDQPLPPLVTPSLCPPLLLVPESAESQQTGGGGARACFSPACSQRLTENDRW